MASLSIGLATRQRTAGAPKNIPFGLEGHMGHLITNALARLFSISSFRLADLGGKMTSGIERRLSRLEGAIRRRRLHTLWVEPGMSDANIEAEIERRRSAGILDDTDELILFTWQAPHPPSDEAQQ